MMHGPANVKFKIQLGNFVTKHHATEAYRQGSTFS